MVTTSAEVYPEELRLVNPLRLHVGDIDLSKIYLPLTRPCGCCEAFPLWFESSLIDFVTTEPNGGTQGHKEVPGRTTKFHSHHSYHLSCDAECGALPSSMDRGNRLFFRINDHDGKAVCGFNPQERTGNVSDGGIVFQRGGEYRWRFLQHQNPVLVDLIEQDQVLGMKSEGSRDPLLIL